jgi:hypothetical protein
MVSPHLSGSLPILITSSGSFGSTFWQKDSTNRAASHSNEETWSTAAIDENATSQNDNRSSGNNKKTKKNKRKAWLFVSEDVGIIWKLEEHCTKAPK